MYKAFYGLKKDPFGLNPDPHFLFPSERHRNAFRYLIYGIKNREGFIEIIGDVGTGKTLLCRALLALLGDDVKSALILNPPFTELEFFETIMDDLGVEAQWEDRKQALDALSNFLLEEYHQGRNVVIIIDEAQHLTIDLLEQVRLISNIETEQKKLLQIILVGQPELEDRLRAAQLKQLDQRITLRYYLEPLKKSELKQYIYHRLRVAGSTGDIKFTSGALRKIYQFSKGVPRLINVVCDKSLLTGYFFRIKNIGSKHVKIALRSTQRRWRRFPSLSPITLTHAAYSFVIFSVISLIIINWKFHKDIKSWTEEIIPSLTIMKTILKNPLASKNYSETEQIKELSPEQAAPAGPTQYRKSQGGGHQGAEIQKPPIPNQPSEKLENTSDISGLDKSSEAIGQDAIALSNLLKLWNLEKPIAPRKWERNNKNKLNYAKIARQYNLDATFLTADLEELEVINLPCLLEDIEQPASEKKVSVVLKGLEETEALVVHPKQGELIYPREELAARWAGKILVLWRNIDNLSDTTASPWQQDQEMNQVEQRLRQLGYLKEEQSKSSMERRTQRMKALMNFQQDHHLEINGVCGVRTKLVLYSIIDQPFSPTLKGKFF